MAGLETVPAVIRKTTPRGMLEMALIENVQRVDLHPLERAKAFQRLMVEFRLTNAELSRKVGKSSSFISNTIKLLQLPDAIKDGLLGGLISEGHARALAGITNARLMVEAYKVLLKENGSVRRAEALARMMNEQLTKTPEPQKKEMKPILDSELELWQGQLQKALGRVANVKVSRSVRQTKVYITLNGDPQRTQPALEKILQLARE
jgi:ParB family chromosome partitioning protein